MITKTKKVKKQSGAGVFSRFKRIFKKNPKKVDKPIRSVESVTKVKSQTKEPEDDSKEDLIFKKLCKKKLDQYIKNPEEGKGALFNVCSRIYKKKFNIHKKVSVKTDSHLKKDKMFQELLSELNELLSRLQTIKDQYEDITYRIKDHSLKPIDKINIKYDITLLQSKLERINIEIRELYLKKKELDPELLVDFNEKYDELAKKLKEVFEIISKEEKRSDLGLNDFKLANNNFILSSDGKRLIAPNDTKIYKLSNLTNMVLLTLMALNTEINIIGKQYELNVNSKLKTNNVSNNNLRQMHGLIAEYVTKLKEKQRDINYYHSKYIQAYNEYKTYKSEFVDHKYYTGYLQSKKNDLHKINSLCKSTLENFTNVFNKITKSEYKEKLGLPDFELNKNNFTPREVSPL